MGLYSIEFHPMELHPKSHYKAFHFHQYFYYTLQVIYQLFYFYIYSFYSLKILLCRIINPLSHIPFSVNSLHSHLHLSSFHLCLLLQTLTSNLHLHLQVLCHSVCLVSLVLDIRLNTVTFMFLIVSETYIFVYS